MTAAIVVAGVAVVGWAATAVYCWRRISSMRHELEFLERLNAYQHDAILRLSTQLWGRGIVEQTIGVACQRGRN